jgi:uncharacterized membrane protein
MHPELLLPGSVMLLKSLYRLSVDREVDLIRVVKAILSLPVDLAFLACSYASSLMILSYLKEPDRSLSVGAILATVVVYLSIGVIVAIVCSKADKHFDLDNNVGTLKFAGLSYVISALVLIATMLVVK